MRRQLAILVIAALLPLTLVSVAMAILSAAAWRADMRREALDQAHAAATLVRHELDADMREAQMIAQSPSFDKGLDRAWFTQLANRLVERQPHWHVISVSDAGGTRVLDAPEPIGGAERGPVVDLPSQQAVVRSRRPGVGPLVIGPEHHAAFAVRAPVIRDGAVRYVVSIVVQPQTMRELIEPGVLRPGWAVRLVDAHGTVVAATDLEPGARLAGRGRSHALTTWSVVGGDGWRVAVVIPQAAYQAPLLRGLAWTALALVGAVGLGGLFVWLLWREWSLEHQRQAAAVEGHRLEALGRMTGGIAHDVNNLLTPIMGALEILRRRSAEDPSALRLLDTAMQAAERVKALASRLLTFARRQTLETRDIDVAALMTSLLTLVQQSVRPEVSVRLALAEGLPLARSDPSQLELTLLNLAVNANDAMPTGGVLTLTVAAETLERVAADLAPGRYVRIRVIDTGVGMSGDTLKRAVEPFFTTKGPGAGTGLGLSMAHGLAAQSGGALRLASELGKGTTVEIWLPAA